MKKTVMIEGMHCSHCSSRVEKALSSMGFTVSVNLDEKKAVVESASDFSDDDIRNTIEDLGFDVVKII